MVQRKKRNAWGEHIETEIDFGSKCDYSNWFYAYISYALQ